MRYHNNLKEGSEILHCNTKDTCSGFTLKSSMHIMCFNFTQKT